MFVSLAGEPDPAGALRSTAERLPQLAELVVRAPCRRNRAALEEMAIGDGYTVAELTSLLEEAGLEPTRVRMLREPGAKWTPPRIDGSPVDVTVGRLTALGLSAVELEEFQATEIELTAARRDEFVDGPGCSVIVAGKSARRFRAGDGREVIAVGRSELPAAWNEGARRARGRLLAFVDGDAVPEPGWLEALAEVHASGPEVGAVGGLSLDKNGSVAHAGIVFGPFGVPYHVHRGASADLPALTRTRAVPALAGCALLVARRTFVALGAFDEELPAEHALIDLCLRLRARGLVPVFCPRSRLRLRREPTADRSEQAAAADRLLLDKWEGRLWADERSVREDGVDPVDARPKPRPVRGPCALAWAAPLFVRSGYAEEARSFVLALDDAGYAVNPIDVARVTSGSGPADARLLELTESPLPSPFAHVVHYHGHGIPVRPDAVRRVWRTMFESDRLPPGFAEYGNQMDEVWVPSDFNLETFARAGIRPTKLRKLPGGLDFAPYDPDVAPWPLEGTRAFVFLSVLIPQRRKGWDVLLRAYQEEFAGDEDVTLVIKATAGPEQAAGFADELEAFVRRELGRDPSVGPPVHFLRSDLEPEAMPRLYRAADAYVLPSRGEGWSRTAMEAMAMRLPVIATRWGGHLEFMNDQNSYLVDATVTAVDELAAHELPIFRGGQRWAEPSVEHLRELMRHVFEDRAEARARGARARRDVLAGYGTERMAAALLERVDGLGLEPMRRPRRRAPARTKARVANGPAPVVWSSPVFDRTGYANEARAFVLALDRAGLDVHANPSFLAPADYQPPSSADRRLRALTARRPPERFVHVVHSPSPHFEPEAPAVRTVWRTMFETDGLPPDWVAKANEVDAVWVCSHHNLESFARAGVDPRKLRWVPAGLEVELYDPTVPPLPIPGADGFVFLSVFGWGRRKGWDVLARAYLEEFSSDEDVSLVINTYGTLGRTLDDQRAELERFVRTRLGKDPNAGPPIVVLGLDLLPEEMPRLYRAADAYVQPSRGEGFPRPPLEAMAMGVPAIGSRCPGMVEFMTDENSYLVDCTWQPVPEDAAREFPLYRGHRWAEPSVEQLRHQMRHVFDDRAEAVARGARARDEVLSTWDWRRLAAEVTAALEELGCPPARRRALARTGAARNLGGLGDVLRRGWAKDVALERIFPGLDGNTNHVRAGHLVYSDVSAGELEEAGAAGPALPAGSGCSVVVAGRAGGKLERCLEAVRATAAGEELVPVERRPGLSLGAAWNLGAAKATGRYLAFLDGRSLPEPGWLEALLDAHGERPDVGLAGSLLEEDGAVVHAGVALGALGAPYLLYRGASTQAPEVLRRRPLSAVTGSGLLVERRTFVAAGGFDESYPDGHEAIDLSLRLRSRGLSAVYCPESRLRHPAFRLSPEGDRRLFRRWMRRLSAEDEAICRQDGTDVLHARPEQRPTSAPSPLLWTASLFTRTGYAEEARNLILALDRLGLDVHAEAMDLGDLTTRLGPDDHRLLQLTRSEPRDGFVHVHHYPNTVYRASALAARNVWRTMFESDGLPNDWVSRANEMDEVWVPSDFNLETFARAGVRPEKLHKVPGGLPLEGYDATVEPLPLPGLSGFVFLSIFGWEPRKGWDVLLRAYLEEFGPDEDVTLALKIFPHYLISFADLFDTIAAFSVRETGRPPSRQPRVVLIEQAVPPAEMPRLYRTADAFVLPSRGEGWGRTHAEAMAMGLPVIGTRWSGNLEFMNDGTSYLVDCRPAAVPERSAKECPHYRGHNWAEPSAAHLRRLMRQVFEDRAEAAKRGARARREIVNGFGVEQSAAAAVERLEAMGAPPRKRARAPRAPRVLWEGPQLGNDGCARFNRLLSGALLGSGRFNLALSSTEPERLLPAEADVPPASPAGRPFAEPPHVVITSAPVPGEAPPAGRRIGIPAWPHGSLPLEWVEAARRMEEVWVPSDYLHDCCVRSGLDPQKLALIRPGIDTERYRPGLRPLALTTRRSFRFLHLGGDGLEVGTDAVLEAYGSAFDASDDICLVVAPRAGSEQLARLVERFRQDLRAPEVLLLDDEARAELPRLCAACDCLVHAPRADSDWLELAEAQACGLPAVVANHGTGRELCDPGTAFLVPAVEIQLPQRRVGGDETVDFPWWAEIDRKGLAQALRRAAERPEETRELGRAAAEYVRRRYSLEAAAAVIQERLQEARWPARPPAEPAPLSLCMMVRNEGRYLEDCLQSVEGLVAEVVVVDTGSTDDTVEIAKRHGARVRSLPWADDFGAPRNAAIEHARQPWILMIDADHTLDPASRDEVRRLTHTRSLVGYMLRGLNYLDPTGIRMIEGYDPRLFPNHPAIRFSGSVHEQLTCSRPELGFQVVPCGVVLHHHGARADGYSRLPKLLRDVPMLETAVAADPDDPFQVFNLGSTYLFLERFPDAEAALRRALELCRSRSARTSYPQYMLSVQLNLAKALMGQARHHEAEAECAEVARAAPGLAEAHALRGIALSRLGRLDEAAACFEASLLCPDWPMYGATDPAWRGWRSLLGIAEIRLLQGRGEEALTAAERAQRLSPDNPAVWSTLAHVYRGLGRFREADACRLRAGTG